MRSDDDIYAFDLKCAGGRVAGGAGRLTGEVSPTVSRWRRASLNPSGPGAADFGGSSFGAPPTGGFAFNRPPPSGLRQPAGRVPTGSRMVASRLGTGATGEGGRPMTSVQGAGYQVCAAMVAKLRV